jgi:hypothetical protein
MMLTAFPDTALVVDSARFTTRNTQLTSSGINAGWPSPAFSSLRNTFDDVL